MDAALSRTSEQPRHPPPFCGDSHRGSRHGFGPRQGPCALERRAHLWAGQASPRCSVDPLPWVRAEPADRADQCNARRPAPGTVRPAGSDLRMISVEIAPRARGRAARRRKSGVKRPRGSSNRNFREIGVRRSCSWTVQWLTRAVKSDWPCRHAGRRGQLSGTRSVRSGPPGDQQTVQYTFHIGKV